jgi:hypothetical protein
VLQNEVGLNEYIDVGTRLDARVSRELVTSIFLPESPIHDGALIIQNGRITAAGCFLPLTTNPNGTGKPALVRICKLRALPPTNELCPARASEKGIT